MGGSFCESPNGHLVGDNGNTQPKLDLGVRRNTTFKNNTPRDRAMATQPAQLPNLYWAQLRQVKAASVYMRLYRNRLEHRAEKRIPVFRKSDAKTKI
jgi:hypothetical protein